MQALQAGTLPSVKFLLDGLAFVDGALRSELRFKVVEGGVKIMESQLLSLPQLNLEPTELGLDLWSQLEFFYLALFGELLIESTQIPFEDPLLVCLYFLKDVPLLPEFPFKIIKSLEVVIPMGTKERAMRADPLFVRYADNIKDHFMFGTEFVVVDVSQILWTDQEIPHQIIFLLIHNRLLHDGGLVTKK